MNDPTETAPIRLTQYSHGGGCGCKIAPAVLAKILANSGANGLLPPELLVGTECSDDAAVYQINESQAIIATTDFFTPIVDNAFDFGRIAAANAISDVYAMGGKPIFALAIVGMPIDRLPAETVRQILAGGETMCAAAGIPVAGGHSIDTPEPIYGLVVLGIVRPDRVKRNNMAHAGDVLVLGKPLGIGVMSAALKKGELSEEGYYQMLAGTTQLNTPGHRLAEMPGVHAMTDVTGFALLGHLLEICRGSQMGASLHLDRLPCWSVARDLAQRGYATGAGGRNWSSYGHEVVIPAHIPDWQLKLLNDPQTNGGLLVTCAPDAADDVLAVFQSEGFDQACVVGCMHRGQVRVTVR